MSLRLEETGRVPAPSATLRALVEQGGAVRMRSPMAELGSWLGLGALVGCMVVSAIGPRVDLSALEQLRWLASALAWAGVAAIGAWLCVVPRAGQVLPSQARARWVPLAGLFVLVLVTLVLPFETGSLTIHHHGIGRIFRGIAHCDALGLALTIPLVALSWVLLLRRLPVGGATVGAGLGAAAGALSGLVLHVVCPIGGAAHVLAGHVGVVVLGAGLGALSSLLLRR